MQRIAFLFLTYATLVSSHGWEATPKEQSLIDAGRGKEIFPEGRYHCLSSIQKTRVDAAQDAHDAVKHMYNKFKEQFIALENEFQEAMNRFSNSITKEWCEDP